MSDYTKYNRNSLNQGQYFKPPEHLGFELIEYKEKTVYWKMVGIYGEHIILVPLDSHKTVPKFYIIPARVFVYAGPELAENLIHEEIAYTIEDLEELLQYECLAEILPHGSPLI